MGKETISQTTFLKGLTTGVIIAASLGILSIGEYSIDTIDSKEANRSSGAPKITASATPADADNIKIETNFDPEIEIINETEINNKINPESSSATKSGNDSASTTAKFGPGAYSATAPGISSDITVSAIFNENRIIKISADVSGETSRIGAKSGEVLIRKALAAQSAEFDGISGATITSDAFKQALNDCITQAQENKDISAIGGADGPTSLFLAGILNGGMNARNAESQTDSETETESEKDSEAESESDSEADMQSETKSNFQSKINSDYRNT